MPHYAKINLTRVKARGIMTLFMYCLFNDALRDSNYNASNDTLIIETQQSMNIMGNEGFLVHSNLLRNDLPGRTEKISEIFQNNRSSGGNINPGPPKHETARPKLDGDVRWCQDSLSIPY